MGEALRRDVEARRGGGSALARVVARRARAALAALAAPAVLAAPTLARAQAAPLRLDAGRFTAVAYPSDARLARSLLDSAAAHDTFPGLPRPTARVLIAVAPDRRRFRDWAGPGAPEWGAAVAIPDQRRIVMQGSGAGSDAGDPIQVLRHELAHLALHEYLGDLPPRWFDEGYASWAAGEWGRDEVLATSISLVLHGVPSLDSLDDGFHAGASRANAAYALAHRAVAELSALDPERGLALFFEYWRETGSMDRAMRRAYGLTEAAFDARWRADTRRRYGALALLANVGLVMALLGLCILPLYVVRLRRTRRQLAALVAADEAAERAARASALDALLAMAGGSGGSGGSGESTGGAGTAGEPPGARGSMGRGDGGPERAPPAADGDPRAPE